MTVGKLILDEQQIAAFCRRHRILRMALFGSVLTSRFEPQSDVDVLVEFEPGQQIGFGFFAIQDELTEMLGHVVDLNTRGFLSRHFRDHLESKVIYDSSRPSAIATRA